MSPANIRKWSRDNNVLAPFVDHIVKVVKDRQEADSSLSGVSMCSAFFVMNSRHFKTDLDVQADNTIFKRDMKKHLSSVVTTVVRLSRRYWNHQKQSTSKDINKRLSDVRNRDQSVYRKK